MNDILFYPIYYHTYKEGRYNTIAVVAYDEKNEKILVRIRYPYSFYISGIDHNKAYKHIGSLVGVSISESHIVARSTRDPLNPVSAIRVDCDNQEVKIECMRLLENNNIRLHETNNCLTPMLKMMEERKIQYYSWMCIDVEDTDDSIGIGRREYMGDVHTLCVYSIPRPPPNLSILSFDLECNSVDWDVMCDASSHMDNDIKQAAFTYVHGDTYREYLVCNGPNISDIWKRFVDEDVRVIIANDELHLIQLIWAFMQKLDPDIIVGHNIAGFDIPYIITRYNILCMRSGIRASIPNISRFKDITIKPFSLEWNNNQVSMSGKLLYVPGRIWIDTLILAARTFLGQMENNKLDTLAKVHLGMCKNDVSHKDMFAWFSLYNRWSRDERSEDLSSAIKRQYEIGYRKYNKVLPPTPTTISIDDINGLVVMINVMNQRGKRRSVYTKKDGMNIDKEKVYNDLRIECEHLISKWNMPYIEEDREEERIKALWWVVGRYCVHDTRIPCRIIALKNIVPVLLEQSNIFCVSINDILCRGQIHGVTSAQYSEARSLGFLVDFVERGDPSNTGKVGGGYVAKNSPGLKILDNDSVIITFDFKSLYPTIIIANNICYTTWVPYDKRDKEVTRNMCHIIYLDDIVDKKTNETLPPREHWFLKREILPGIVPSMLMKQYDSRDSIRNKQKLYPEMYVIYDAQQKAVKVGMNSAYGAFGTKHSYICNKACADATTGIGRRCIRLVNKILADMGMEVVYNDTDSAMVLIKGIKARFNSDPKKIMEYAKSLSKDLSKNFPSPMQLEPENLFLSFFLRGPKMYTAIKWDEKSLDLSSYGMTYIETNNLLYVKGLASARKDKYTLYKIIYNKILELILLKYDPTIVGRMLCKYIDTVWELKDSTDLSKIDQYLSYNMGVSAKAVSGGTATMAKWISRYESHYRRKPVKGERFKLIVCESSDTYKHTKSFDKLYTSDWMSKLGKKIDIYHYLLCFEAKGGIINLINLAYGDCVPRGAITHYYIPLLLSYNTTLVSEDQIQYRD